ncbi:MAG: sulfatase-like hydrolase/transferase [Gemmatimonadota bacterium]|nr:sulfatase-like hydrolase/transferase [Gemmatimonadota bacterium]
MTPSRREFVRQLGAAGMTLGGAGLIAGCRPSRDRSSNSRAAEQPPNIVLIFTDDQGYGDIGVYGAEGFTTPHLDRLAAEGMRFTDFYASQAVCSASRASLLTGCYAERVSIRGALGPRAAVGLHPDETTIAEVLKPLGYATGMFGKWHLGDAEEFLPLQHGFDVYFGLPYSNDMWPVDYDGNPVLTGGKTTYPPLPLIEGNETLETVDELAEQDQLTTRYAQRAVDFIDRTAGGSFFLYLAHSMPHVPLGVSERFRGRSEQGLYGDVIQEIDWSVGQVMGALDRHGIADDTLVVFTSDNGPWLNYGNHAGSTGGLREGKGTAFEGGPRVPAIMRWPGKIEPGSVCDRLASTIDILPTVATITRADLPSNEIDGVSILPLLLGDEGADPRTVFLYYYGGELRAVREGRWKRVFEHVTRSYVGVDPGHDGHPGPYATPAPRVPAALYDLETDVAETTDVAVEHPDVVARLDDLAEDARATLGDRLTDREGSGVRPLGRRRFDRPDTIAHVAVGATATLDQAPNPRYSGLEPGVLTNGRFGTRDYADGEWIGFQGRDLDAVVDLGEARPIRSVGLDCMQNQAPWIFFPRSIEFSVSTDGEEWELAGRVEPPVERSQESEARLFFATLDAGAFRYVRVVAQPVDPLPDWHAGAGDAGWVIADEIVIEE